MRKLITVVVMALAVAACGGSGDAADTTSGDTATTVAATAETTQAAETTTTAEAATTTAAAETTTTVAEATDSKGLDALLTRVRSAEEMTSARIEGTMTITGLGGVEGVTDVTLPFSTTFDTATGNSSISMDMTEMAAAAPDTTDDPTGGLAAAFLGEIEIRQIGDRAYMRMPFLTAMLGTDAEWVSMPAEEAGDFSTDMGVQTDPYDMLDDYRQAEAEVEELGVESVNGVDATHFKVVVDTEKWLATLSPEERAEIEADGPIPVNQFPMDLWISDEGFLVRMVMEIDGTGIEDDSGETFESMMLTYDVFDINEPVTIVAPEEFVDMEDLGAGFGSESN